MFTNCTDVIVSLLKAWNDCGMDRVPRCRLLTPFLDGTHQKLFSQEKNLNSASKVAVSRCVWVFSHGYLEHGYLEHGYLEHGYLEHGYLEQSLL